MNLKDGFSGAVLFVALMATTDVVAAENQFMGEIMWTGGAWCPRDNWMEARGQLLPISEHESLWSIIGNQYGGDGKTTFALPDLRGTAPIGTGQRNGKTFVTGQYRNGVDCQLEKTCADTGLNTLTLRACIAINGLYPERN